MKDVRRVESEEVLEVGVDVGCLVKEDVRVHVMCELSVSSSVGQTSSRRRGGRCPLRRAPRRQRAQPAGPAPTPAGRQREPRRRLGPSGARRHAQGRGDPCDRVERDGHGGADEGRMHGDGSIDDGRVVCVERRDDGVEPVGAVVFGLVFPSRWKCKIW